MSSDDINLLPNNRPDIIKNRFKKNRQEVFGMRIPEEEEEEEEEEEKEEEPIITEESNKELLNKKTDQQITAKKNIWSRIKNIFHH